MINQVVARFTDGRVIKGMTADFFPNKEAFHMTDISQPGSEPLEVWTKDLKALFFVKDFHGNPEHVESNEFAGPAIARKIRVEFNDGEVLVGTTTGYQANRPGFFVIPADEYSNIERCYVIAASAKGVSFI